MPVATVLMGSNSVHASRIRAVVHLLNSVQRYFRIETRTDDSLDTTGEELEPFALISALSEREPGTFKVGVVDDAFNDNWFSHEVRDTSVITTHGWEEYFAPPSLRAYLAYQIAQSLTQGVVDLSEEMAMNMVHEPPVGCMFDLSIDKPNIRYGMLAGSICPSCVGVLRQLGAPEEALSAVDAILALVRDESIGRPRAIDPKAAFVAMRFTVDDENDHAWKYGIEPGLSRSGFEPSRADSQLQSAPLLAKIRNQITRARLVVVKVDVNNLNVYFELGLAMGLGKDTILISEESLVVDLPTDLANWECLTYTKGSYETLRDRLHHFCSQNYTASLLS